MFLSKAERDYLVSKDQASHDYYCVKSRLLKKLKLFSSQELPLLIERGYRDVAEYCKLAEKNCRVFERRDSLVRIPSDIGIHERENKHVGRERFGRSTPAMSRHLVILQQQLLARLRSSNLPQLLLAAGVVGPTPTRH
jgi:hypothetical protein